MSDHFMRLSFWCDRILNGCISIGIFLLPLFFCGGTLDVLEIHKQTLLVLLVCAGLIAWIAKALLEKRLSMPRTWIHAAVALFGIGYLVISLCSSNRYLSFVGNFGQEAWSFTTVIACLFFYFLVVSEVRTTKRVYDLVFVFLASAFFAALYGLLQMLGWFVLPMAFTHFQNFTSIGSIYSLSVFLATALVVASAISFHGCRDHVCLLGQDSWKGRLARVVLWATMLLSFACLLMIDFWVSWAVVLFGTVIIVIAGKIRAKRIGHPAKLLVPIVLLVVGVLLLFFKPPWNLNLPSEVSPSFSATWDIARQTLQAHPAVGSGPGTWVYDYAAFRSLGVNASPFWSVRFDRGISAFLTLLPTVGIVGILLWLLLMIVVIAKSIVHLIREPDDDVWYAFVMVFAGWAGLVLTSFFYNFNVAHLFLFWVLTALVVSFLTRGVWALDGRRNKAAYGLIVAKCVGVVLFGILVCWMACQRLAADWAFSKSVNDYQANKPIAGVLVSLDRAVRLNGFDDAYIRNLAQAHLLHAATQMQTGATDAQIKMAQAEISKAIDLGLRSTKAAPANVDNWSNLGVMYRSIASFTSGADEQSIRNYQEALKREPLNPVFYDEIGQLFVLRADAYATKLQAKDAKVKTQAQKDVQDNLAAADMILRKAIAAKPDYLPAHYHMAGLFQREGKLADAKAELIKVLQGNPQDAGVAFELAILYYQDPSDKDGKSKAMALLEQIVKAEPQYVNARWYLALMEQDAGRIDDAITQLQALVQQLPDNAAVKQRLTTLLKTRSAAGNGLPEPLPETIQNQTGNTVIKGKK